MSADFRVTNPNTKQVIDDASVKMLNVHFPGGTRALLAYSGLAALSDGTTMGTWLTETMRGESEVPDAAMAHLLKRLNRDIAKYRVPFMLGALLIEGEHGERRLFGGFSNQRLNSSGRIDTVRSIGYRMDELPAFFAFANGSGAVQAIADGELDRVGKLLNVPPRRAIESMNLLATINRRVAARNPTVSPACHVAFMPAVVKSGVRDERFGPISKVFRQGAEPAPAVMPVLLFGIDLTAEMQDVQARMAALEAGTEPPPDIDPAEFDRLHRRRE